MKKIKNALLILSGVLVSLIIAPLVIIYAFTGPSGSAGSGYGAIKYDQSNNRLGFSTSTLIIGTSTLDPLPINPPTTPALPTDSKLFVNGQLVANSITAYEVSSTVINGGNFAGKISANDVIPGTFNSNCAGGGSCTGNYSFPSKVGIGVPIPTSALDILNGDVSINSGKLEVNYAQIAPAISGSNTYGSGGIGIYGYGYIGIQAQGSTGGYDFLGSGQTSYFAGKVGIGPGAGAPARQLEVGGTFQAATSTFTGQIDTVGFKMNVGTNLQNKILTSDGSGVGTWQNNNATLPSTGAANYLARWSGVNTLTSSTLFQDTSGYIGMGVDPTGQSVKAKLAIYDPAVTDANSAQLKLINYRSPNLVTLNLGRTPNYGFIQTQNGDPLVLNPISNNVGIGTSTPSYVLDVNGTFRATATSTFSGGNIIVSRTGSGVQFSDGSVQYTAANPGSGTANYISRWDSSGTQLTTSTIFQLSSNIGIGTSNPSAKLEVVGGLRSASTTLGSTSADPITFAGSLVSGISFNDTGAKTISFTNLADAAGQNLTIAAGTSYYNTALHNGGNLTLQGGAGRDNWALTGNTIYGGDVNIAGGAVAAPAGSASTRIGGNVILSGGIPALGGTNGSIIFNSGGAEKMRVASSGKVGIGTTAPNSTLQVNGSFATKVMQAGGNYAISPTDHIIVETSAGSTVTLPLIYGVFDSAGRQYIIKNMSSGNITIAHNASDGGTYGDFDGTASTITLASNQSIILVSDNWHWLRLAAYP